ncbi:hypothetical protein L195_g044282, partial [Trifolium pratense]
MLFMKNNKNTTSVHPHPQIPATGHRKFQIPASHRRRKIQKIPNQLTQKPLSCKTFFFLSAGPKIINPNPQISIPQILICMFEILHEIGSYQSEIEDSRARLSFSPRNRPPVVSPTKNFRHRVVQE